MKVTDVQKRQIAVTELSSSESPCISLLKKIVSKLPDLEKMLCSAYHKKVSVTKRTAASLYYDTVFFLQCSPADFCVLMHQLNDICSKVESCSEMVLTHLHSEVLHCIAKQVRP